MAIGLGKMFGFHFLKNFNYPYVSKSITEFWRRWHISLGTWFRDYVYFPLGGSRVSKKRLVLNLFIVWSLTGIWHGANWTFLIWGIMYFLLLTFEKLTKWSQNKNKLSHIYTMFFIIIGWVIFKSNSVSKAWNYILVMLGITKNNFIDDRCYFYFSNYYIFFILGIFFSFPLQKYASKVLKHFPEILNNILCLIGYIIIFFVSLSYIIKGAYSPFIYFNF